MFIWAGGRRDRIFFRNPTSLNIHPADLPSDVSEVWYADCCPTDLSDPAGGRQFRVFDHHISNQRMFPDDPRCVFDMSRSGTSLMAHVLGLRLDLRGERLVSALEAYDLGRFEDTDGQRLADIAATYSQEMLLDLMVELGPQKILDSDLLSERAAAMASVRKLYADSAISSAFFSHIYIPVAGYLESPIRIGVCSSPVYWKNEVSERILNSGNAELAVILDYTAGMVSLRSRPGGPDCSLIAILFGGGGHARAAGFRMKERTKILSSSIQEIFR